MSGFQNCPHNNYVERNNSRKNHLNGVMSYQYALMDVLIT